MEEIFLGEWCTALIGILLLDLILSGDNAILIALACKNLPKRQRIKAIVIGGLGAVLIRIVFTLFATSLLSISYLQFLGGVALIYISVRLLTEKEAETSEIKIMPMTFMAAVKTILIADFIMSIDNVLSLAAMANTVTAGKWSLIICGLLISIPIVLCGAQVFLLLIRRCPAIIYMGAAVLAYTGSEMMVRDQAVGNLFIPYAAVVKMACVIFVLTIGWYINREKRTKTEYQMHAK